MGEIKSALEIALEKTMGISVDKQSIEADEYVKMGKKIISGFLNDDEADLDGCFKGLEKKQVEWVRGGMFRALLANLFLPNDTYVSSNLKRVEEGFLKIITNTKKLKLLFNQLESFFSEYIDGRKRLREQIEAQYAPRLRQKEEAMSKQFKTPVRLDPESDPEFKKILSKTVSQFEGRYKSVLEQVKGELEIMFKE
ncbi:MAG: hypothetical protein JXJ04_13080 [Spirochaetales bacterium]|nr:hypothetical protein [Spirochaetales bacterium]